MYNTFLVSVRTRSIMVDHVRKVSAVKYWFLEEPDVKVRFTSKRGKRVWSPRKQGRINGVAKDF